MAEFVPVKEYLEYSVRIMIHKLLDGRNVFVLPAPVRRQATAKGHSQLVVGCSP